MSIISLCPIRVYTPNDFGTLVLMLSDCSSGTCETRDLPFEIAQINALVDTVKDADEFDGFSQISEGEVSCLTWHRTCLITIILYLVVVKLMIFI